MTLVPLLNVEDVPRSLDFYRDALGLQLSESWEDGGRLRWARVEAPGITLMLNEHGEQADARRTRPAYRDVVLYLSVENARALHGDLATKGFTPGPLREEPYGLLEFALRDPDGYELALTSPLRERTSDTGLQRGR